MRKNKSIGPVGEIWDSKSYAERLLIIRKDSSMRDPHWSALASRWASRSWAELSGLEREATLELITGH